MPKKSPLQAGPLSEAGRAGLLAFGARAGLPLAPADYAPLFGLVREEWLAPKALLLRTGEPCERVYLVLSGVARQGCTYAGRYHTVGFALPQGLLTDSISFFGQAPAQLDLVAVTRLHVLSLTHAQVAALYATHPAWEPCGRRLAEAHLRRLARRALSLQVQPAAARYAELMRTHAHLFNLVPLNQLASYLGMARETLSRLRRGGPTAPPPATRPRAQTQAPGAVPDGPGFAPASGS